MGGEKAFRIPEGLLRWRPVRNLIEGIELRPWRVLKIAEDPAVRFRFGDLNRHSATLGVAMTGNTSEQLPPAAITSPEGGVSQPESDNPRPISRLWVVIGCFALLLGLAMGFVMSSLGK